MHRRIRTGFTLIELLVVVAVIGLLTAILMPSLRSARVQARRTVCGTHLRQIGVAMQGYLGDHGDRFPLASALPSVGPSPVDSEEPLYIADVLGPYLSRNESVFQCPSDVAGRIDRPAPATGLSYFQSERSSYQYRVRLGPLLLAGRTMDEVANRIESFFGEPAPVNTIWYMRDYNNFHRGNRRVSASDDEGQDGAPASAGQRNYLYVDGHVADYEKY